jgi:carbamoyltransferase
VWLQPASGDDGIAIGCAYYGHLAIQKKPRNFVMAHAYLGAPYSEEQVKAAAKQWLVDAQVCNGPDSGICNETAKVLAEEKVVGWFQGGSEFGPRALGNRSILADPRKAEMKDLLNSRVKYRQAFRPFAPIVLAERATEIFEGDEDSPFMLLAKRVRPEWRSRVPAIVHVDGTARVQTVKREHNERLYLLLKAFERLTGVPVLLNTSFNIKGEPIVESPADAMKCFLSTGIDYLAMHDMLIAKNRYYRRFYPIIKWGRDVATMVRTGVGVEPTRGED